MDRSNACLALQEQLKVRQDNQLARFVQQVLTRARTDRVHVSYAHLASSLPLQVYHFASIALQVSMVTFLD